MADHIPFVNGETDCRLIQQFYPDSKVMRVCLEKAAKLRKSLPAGVKLWIDATVDGLDRPYDKSKNLDWKGHISRFPNYADIGNPLFQSKPDTAKVGDFVSKVLDCCMEEGPAAVSVPQLPLVGDGSRNKINRALADATGKWRSKTSHKVRIILPAILTSQDLTSSKTVRNEKRKAIHTGLEKSEADGLWIVDASLSDQKGMGTFRKRFLDLVRFHEEVSEGLPEKVFVIAGPYWGMNLVLWSRGLCRFPAIGVGSAYQYHIAGGMVSQSVVRLALPPLRRWAQVGSEFKQWLTDAMGEISPSDPAYAAFGEIRSGLSLLANREASRVQIAKFYKQWCDEIEAVAPAGRALALYQMLSSAYVLGKALPDLPEAEKTARRPERVAEALMLSCL